MTVKPTVSLTDQGYALAKSLVESGKFASVSAVLQHGLRLVEREEQSHEARLKTISRDLETRAREPVLSADELDEKVDLMLAERRAVWLNKNGT